MDLYFDINFNIWELWRSIRILNIEHPQYITVLPLIKHCILILWLCPCLKDIMGTGRDRRHLFPNWSSWTSGYSCMCIVQQKIFLNRSLRSSMSTILTVALWLVLASTWTCREVLERLWEAICQICRETSQVQEGAYLEQNVQKLYCQDIQRKDTNGYPKFRW